MALHLKKLLILFLERIFVNNSNFTKQDIAEDDGSYVLSAIVLVYNGLPYLEECINSLVNQTLDNLEILLINDASTDDSLSVCKKFEKMYDNVRLIDKEKNEGLATSANLGISLARGEYIILVDNDDIIPSYAYEKLYNKAKESDADVCTGKANFLIGQSQFEFDFRENYVWRKEQVIEDVNDFPELFEDAYYWNKIIRKDLLMKHDIKLPIGMIYADRYFAHMAYVYANKVAIIPDCVYLWRQIKSSLSQGRRNTDNYVNRLDSYDLDLDYLIKSCDIYFKMLLRRIIIPIKGILNNSEFEDVVFNRVRFLIKEQEKEFDNLYDNDLNLIDNIYAYLISNNYKTELKQLLQLDLKYQRDVYDEDGKSYWNLPLFRNPDISIPDGLFEIKQLTNQFVTIDELNVTKEKIIFSNIQIPRYLEIEKLQLVFMGLTNYENLLEENSIYFDLNAINRNGIKVYSIEISTDELSYFEKYDVFLNVIYKNEKSIKLRINEISIKEIICDVNNMKPVITPAGNVSLITQNLNKEFRIDCDKDKVKIILRDQDTIKKNLKFLVRKDSTRELIHFTFNEEEGIYELEWKYFLDPRSSYLLFLTIFNDKGEIKRNIRFKDNFLIDFSEKSLRTSNNLNAKIYDSKNGEIWIKSL